MICWSVALAPRRQAMGHGAIVDKWDLLWPHLDERQRRLWAGEARIPGRRFEDRSSRVGQSDPEGAAACHIRATTRGAGRSITGPGGQVKIRVDLLVCEV